VARVTIELRHGKDVLAVELDGAAGAARVRLGDRIAVCDWRRLGPGCYSLVVEGRVHDLWVESSGDGYAVLGREGEIRLVLADPRRVGAQGETEERGAGLRRIAAEMPGKVVRVLVSPGDVVAFDQALLVLEAM
jgi:acetyl/propionyl-CoA carboxylase alpha subunit